jgi:hypothetical protein
MVILFGIRRGSPFYGISRTGFRVYMRVLCPFTPLFGIHGIGTQDSHYQKEGMRRIPRIRPMPNPHMGRSREEVKGTHENQKQAEASAPGRQFVHGNRLCRKSAGVSPKVTV